MDRQTVYAGATPRSQDFLLNGQHAMVGLGFLIQDLLGTATQIFGAAASPGTGLTVSIAPGRIYAQEPLEATAWSSLPADTTDQVMKQGILLAASTLSGFAAPGTTGQSIDYLICGQYQDSDGNPLTLTYYNATNPQQPFSGAGNNGVAQNTVRQGIFALQVVAGVAATTGSQTVPATPSGWSPMYVVTVAYGQSSISTGNIALATAAPFAVSDQSGSFILTGTGCTTSPTATVYYRAIGPVVTLSMQNLAGTSNATTFTGIGLPTSLQPASYLGSQVVGIANAINNGAAVQGFASIGAGTISFGVLNNLSGWTSSGSKSVAGVLSYLLY